MKTKLEVENFKQAYSQFKALALTPVSMQSFAEEAFAKFAEQGLPSTKLEAYKYTNFKPLQKLNFANTKPRPATEQEVKLAQKHQVDGAVNIIVVNGFCQPLSEEHNGLELDEIREPRNLTEDRNQHFRNLNTAFLIKPLKITIKEKLNKPVHIIHLFTGAGGGDQIYAPLTEVNCVKGSQACVVETIVSDESASGLISLVSDFYLDEDAKLDVYRLQKLNEQVNLVLNSEVSAEARSQFEQVDVTLGANISRLNWKLKTKGPQAEVKLNGLAVLHDKQHMDCNTQLYHQFREGISDHLYKTVLQGSSRSVFTGKIYIAQDAQKVDSNMLNKNLLLSEKAEVDTKPELEIFADDVKATHGATLGRLSDEEIFYLQSRAIDRKQAEELLTLGFAREIIIRIKNKSVRDYVSQQAEEKVQAIKESL